MKHSLMPIPVQMKLGHEELEINSDFSIGLSGHYELRLERAAIRLTERLIRFTGIQMHRNLATTKEVSTLQIHTEGKSSELQRSNEDESYNLNVKNKQATLHAKTIYGALRGIETFLQLVRLGEYGFIIPEVEIVDYPRFPWRGLLIDATRHWIPPEVIKRNLEAMAMVKLNVLHWHLTNDQGFRIECKRYPLLHKLGSDNLFYTHKDVKEIIEFASDRGIRVLPEFDMPGHTSSWFVGYPKLASSPGPYKIERRWGGFDATMNPTKETTYEFIRNFLSEMATLFHDTYVHVGGDQVNGKHWRDNKSISKFMLKENIADVPQLLTHFNLRLHEILKDLGKQMIGWDPILDSNLPKRSIIQTVRGQKWLAQAATEGFSTVAGSEYYLDLLRPAAFHYLSDPFDDEASQLTIKQKEMIVGGEASIWTEFVTEENIDSRIWPKAAAIAERLWSPSDTKDIEDMYRRLEDVGRHLDHNGVKNEAGPRQMLYRLSNFGSIKSLSILAEMLQPTFETRWENSKYTSLSPLNRLVDAIVPESNIARDFGQSVTRFIANRSDNLLYDRLERKLKIWSANLPELKRDIQDLPYLKELEPLIQILSQITEIGLKYLHALHLGQTIELPELKKQMKILEDATRPIAELKISIAADIQNLAKAVLSRS